MAARAGIRHREAHVVALEGRRLDTIVGRDGSELSPYEITLALQGLSGLNRFKVTQRAYSELLVELEADADAQDGLARKTRSLLREILGEDTVVDIRFRDRLVPEGSRKFGTIESLVLRQ